ncbi:hypothetical protein [Variovorax sp. OV329]|uniref:hypothetical protein n=1 Tax=Variovorax sp. OV329 TaxID=1882825 RepID=UPI0008E62659|nr:hypothetical protein [Variovorax sp. OV329]SFL87521.1 4-amino-4-deoxy-L-arabinose transferase [Variovorax sp. OV329]
MSLHPGVSASLAVDSPHGRQGVLARQLLKPEVLILLAILSLVVRVLLIPEPVLMSDEYYYIKTSQLWHDGTIDIRSITSLPTRGEAKFPNSLFFAIYQLSFYFGDSFYAVAKLFNVFFASVAALAIASVARRFMSDLAAAGVAVLALWLPSSSFLPYFMPEALYEALVWLGIAALFALYERRLRLAMAVLGACTGAALLAKPNALAVIAACNLVAVCLLWKIRAQKDPWRQAIVCLLLLNLCFVMSGYLLNLLLTGQLHWDPMGKFYENGLSKVGEVDAGNSFIEAFARYLAVYVFIVLLVFGSALLAMGVGAASGKSLSTGDVLLLAMTAFGVGVLLLGSVKVAVNWERVYVNHIGLYSSRYMSVMFPLFMIGFVRFLPDAAPRRRTRMWVGGVLVLACLLLMGTRSYVNNWLQVRDLFWPRELPPVALRLVWAAMLLPLVYCTLARAPKARVYVGVIALYALSSGVVLWKKDFLSCQVGSERVYADAARTVRSLVRPELYDQGHVVFNGQTSASLFMSTFPGIVSVTRLSVDPQGHVPPSARWVVYLDGIRPESAAGCMVLKSTIFCPLGEGVLIPTAR